MISELPFGTTGHASTRIIFGAAALGEVTQEEADTTLALVRSHGINHLDTAASYGESELRLAPFLADHRDDVFLATKTGERDGESAWAEINRSLERLQTDHVDLLQLHNLVDEAEWRQVYAPGGVLEAAVRARAEGLVRAIGVTGHGVTVAQQHLRSLQEFEFASVLLPYNFPMSRNEAYLDEFEALVAVCADRGVAVQTIKSITKAPWSEGAEQHRRDRHRGRLGARSARRLPQHGRRHPRPAPGPRRRGALLRRRCRAARRRGHGRPRASLGHGSALRLSTVGLVHRRAAAPGTG
jgi:aryl-alcohol dehydrogenase-like predicted oxidoreductase